MSIRSHIGITLMIIGVLVIFERPLKATTYYSPFYGNDVLYQGDSLRSGGDCTEMRFHYDGGYFNRLNFVTIGGGSCGSVNWNNWSDFDWQGIGQGTHASASEPRGMRAARAIMQLDGNFVVYDLDQTPEYAVWSTQTSGNSGAYLNVQDDGNMVIYSSTNAVLWSLF